MKSILKLKKPETKLNRKHIETPKLPFNSYIEKFHLSPSRDSKVNIKFFYFNKIYIIGINRGIFFTLYTFSH